MAKDLNVFDKEYGLLINGEWTKGSEGKLRVWRVALDHENNFFIAARIVG